MSHKRSSVNRPPTPVADGDHPNQELSLQEIINIKLIESGEKERLKDILREKLIECGWKDEMKALCRSFVRKKGRNNVTVDDLVHVITPKGRGGKPMKLQFGDESCLFYTMEVRQRLLCMVMN